MRQDRRPPWCSVRGARQAATIALALSAIGSSPQEPEAPRFPAETELVLVDAIVLDRSGRPVEGLEAEDFSVREDGVLQSVTHFEAIGLPESAPSHYVGTRFVSTNARAGTVSPPSRLFAIVFDDAQLSRATAERARTAIQEFLRDDLRDDDAVLLVSTAGGAWWSTRLGEGRGDLLAILARLDGQRRVDSSGSWVSDYESLRLAISRDRQIGAQVIRRFYENGVILDPGTQAAAEARQQLDLGEGHPLVRVKAAEAYANAKQRNLATLRSLERLAESLAVARGRKSVLLVSDGFVHDPTLPEYRSVTAAMSRANAVIYFLDARGLAGTAEHAAAEVGRATQERDVLSFLGQAQLETEGSESLALDTGGYAFRNPNDLVGGMVKIAQETRAYYLVGYVPGNARADGRFRRIQVEVRQPDLQVRARKGYYAPDASQSSPVTTHGLDLRLRRVLDSPYAVDGIPLRMSAYVFGAASEGKASVLLVAEADPGSFQFTRAKDRSEATLDSYLVVTSRDTGQSYPLERKLELSLPPEVRTRLERSWLPLFRGLELPPGTYQARLLLRDSESGSAGSVRHEFEVPPRGQLRVSTPILTDSLQADPQGGPARPVPLARRAFAPAFDLVYAFEVHDAAKDAQSGEHRVVSRYEILRSDGTLVARTQPSPIKPGARGELARQTAIPLQGLAPGDYEFVLSVEDQVSGHALERHDLFSVVQPPPVAPSSSQP